MNGEILLWFLARLFPPPSRWKAFSDLWLQPLALETWQVLLAPNIMFGRQWRLPGPLLPSSTSQDHWLCLAQIISQPKVWWVRSLGEYQGKKACPGSSHMDPILKPGWSLYPTVVCEKERERPSFSWSFLSHTYYLILMSMSKFCDLPKISQSVYNSDLELYLLLDSVVFPPLPSNSSHFWKFSLSISAHSGFPCRLCVPPYSMNFWKPGALQSQSLAKGWTHKKP